MLVQQQTVTVRGRKEEKKLTTDVEKFGKLHLKKGKDVSWKINGTIAEIMFNVFTQELVSPS